MEVELVRFVGAGLAVTFAGLSQRPSSLAETDGYRLIATLSVERPTELRSLIEDCSRNLCRGWSEARVPAPVVAQHLLALSTILPTASGPQPAWIRALLERPSHGIDRPLADELARTAAAEIVSAASASGELQRSGLLVHVSLILVHRLLEALIVNADLVESLRSAGGHHAEPSKDDAGPSDDLSAIDRLEIAIGHCAPAICPEPMLAALVAHELGRGLATSAIEAALESKAVACQDLLCELRTLQGETAETEVAGTFEALRTALAFGRLPEVDAELARAESAEQATLDGDGEDTAGGQRPAVAFRTLRARLDELRGNWQSAARHYAVARRYCPSMDVRGRWSLMMRQAAALNRHGLLVDDVRSLFEAAQIHAEAGGLLQEHDAPLDWALAHVELGNLLLNLAEREGRPERYLAAALHFKPAVDVFSRLGAMDDWALAQLGLARAQRGQGEFQGDPVTLADAAFAFRAALGILHAGRSPADWAAAKTGLGLTLVRLAEETGETGLVEDAIAALKLVRSGLSEAAARPIEAALGRAYVVLAGEKDDVAVLSEAVVCFSRALSQETHAARTDDTAPLLRALGTALWALGEAAGDRVRLDVARETLVAARERYAAVGDDGSVEAVQGEIGNLDLVLTRLRRSQRHGPGRPRFKA
ncbi:MAG: hypothetical protein ACT4N2_14555 [Hyphomicrobium sp.]